MSYRFAWAGETLWLKLGAADFAFTPLSRVSARKAAADNAGDGLLRAPMNGRVVSVSAAAGDKVTRGQQVMALEAMKMEHAILAPRDGVLVSVSAAAGDQVSPGQVLAEIGE
ncbi:acetyl-CoA carboxylase biotin carboxyl carrier protein subunit [Camelimonas abortus]|uniref:Acetyl-CoA carboxylase biotin carboxyl carrier protein subunit n=1 Tax=Camelimonas abortus TaxID=1017184 RepID=A0ABV7LDX3_9HYPH